MIIMSTLMALSLVLMFIFQEDEECSWGAGVIQVMAVIATIITMRTFEGDTDAGFIYRKGEVIFAIYLFCTAVIGYTNVNKGMALWYIATTQIILIPLFPLIVNHPEDYNWPLLLCWVISTLFSIGVICARCADDGWSFGFAKGGTSSTRTSNQRSGSFTVGELFYCPGSDCRCLTASGNYYIPNDVRLWKKGTCRYNAEELSQMRAVHGDFTPGFYDDWKWMITLGGRDVAYEGIDESLLKAGARIYCHESLVESFKTCGLRVIAY